MPVVTSYLVTLNGTGTEFPTLNVVSNIEEYLITGTVIATGNYALVPTGTPIQGTKFVFSYFGNLNITTNSKTFSIFGTNVTQNILNNPFKAECEYVNGSWLVLILPSMVGFSINPTNLPANIVATTNLQDGSVTHPKLANDAVETVNVKDLNITTNKLANTSVTTGKMATLSVDPTILANDAVTTIKVLDGNITNPKLNPGANNSVKVTNNSGVISDLSIGANQLLGNLGSGLVAVNTSNLLHGTYEVINIPVSFESGEQAMYNFYIPFAATVVNILYTVVKVVAGTDDGEVDFGFIGATHPTYTQTIPANAALGNSYSSGNLGPVISSTTSSFTWYLSTNKTTAGGKLIVSILLQRT
jgi:hypothetical protein